MAEGFTFKQHKEIVKRLNQQVYDRPKHIPTMEDLNIYVSEAKYMKMDFPDNKYCFELTKYVKDWCERLYLMTKDKEYWQMYWELMLWEAPHIFDSYMIYLEKDREPRSKFYMPRRKQLNNVGLIQALQDIEDDKYDLLTISLPPGTGKTTLEKFFTTWVIGRHPEMYNLFYSHSGDITKMFYEGVLEITTSADYKFSEIFPAVKLRGTNAKAQQITFNEYKPFPNLQTGATGGNLAGKVRANCYLLCDDVIGSMELAMNKQRLDDLWNKNYTGDAKQRKMTGCKEIHIATRWSVHDIIGRLMDMNENNKRAKFISCDCYDSRGRSQFDYEYGVGLSTEFLHDQERYMDDVTFRCLYRNQPIEREGMLYHRDDIRTYLELPTREPDAIWGICDTKSEGTDFFVLPILYQYDDDYYCVDAICNDNADYGRQYKKVADILLKHRVQQCQFESNNGGTRVAFEITKRIKEAGGRCNITEKFTLSNKQTKIIVNAEWVKQHILFKDESMYTPKSEYGVMMRFLLTYSVKAKKQLDDVPDALSSFAVWIEDKFRVRPSAIIRSPI